MMKKQYISPMLDQYAVLKEDVITTSLSASDNGGDLQADWKDRIPKIN